MEETDNKNGYSPVVTIDLTDFQRVPPQEDTADTTVGDENKEEEGAVAVAVAVAPSSRRSHCFMYRLNRFVRELAHSNWRVMRTVVLVVLFLAYMAYFSYCMYHEFGSEPSVRLLVGTVLGLLWLANYLVKRFIKCPCNLSCCGSLWDWEGRKGAMLRKVVRWGLYSLCVGGAVAILVDVGRTRPENMVCLAGMALLILVCFFISQDPEQINWHAVFWGMGLQFWFAVLIKRTTFGSDAFEWLADRFVEFLRYSDKGSLAVFGETYLDHRFVFQLMPTIIFFNAMISVLYYLGVIQIFIAKCGKFLSFCLGTSPIECVNAAANLFLTLSEAPILIKPFIKDITQSELFAVMTGGFASIAGSLLYAFAAYGAPINHILTASVMSAPAALAFAKLIYPDERKPTIKAEDAYKVDVRQYGSMLGALSSGAKEGLSMAGYVVINLLIYVALLAFLDSTILWFTERAGLDGFTFTKLISYVFFPLTYLMGFEIQDCLKAGRLLGVKILTTTTVSFMELGKIITNGKVLQEYIDTYNGTWTSVGDDIFLEATNTTLVGGVLSERSGVLATYMICGLSNMGCIGIAIGAFSSLAPSRTMDVMRQVPLALLAGNFACFSTACMAGLLFTD
ncbi:putative transporter YutK isoform X2 [Babylonia areolata]|uniref:putative transporter YutK isoform X2 n=1 Tax=Babylonia areolata TaxID=304850 RepID=UPI003FD3BA31